MEKGLLLDVGRKFWTIEELEGLIQLLSKNKIPFLQLHLSESLGFRVACETAPEIVSQRFYTKQELKNLLQKAKKLNVEIIPDFDTPGHLGNILKYYPQYALTFIDQNGVEKVDIEALDVTNSKARAFIFGIIQEMLEVFSDSQYVHIGADEFIPFHKIDKYKKLVSESREVFGELASGLEFYVEYVNELAEIIKDNGKTARIWSVGFYRSDLKSLVELTKDVEVCYWTRWDKNMADVQTWLEKGYTLLNYNDNYLYYVLGEKNNYPYPTAEKLASRFSKELFSNEQRLTNQEMQQVKGVFFSIWSDDPTAKTAKEILEDLKRLIPALNKVVK